MSSHTISKIQSHETFNELDAVFLTKPENIIYVLGFGIESESFLVLYNKSINEGKVWLFLNALEYDQAKYKIEDDKSLSEFVEIKQIPGGKQDFVYNTVNELNLKRVGFEDNYIPVVKYNEWKKSFEIPEFKSASQIISDARCVKTEEEIQRMQIAAKLGDIGFKRIFDIIEEGMTEKQLAAEAEYAMRKAGSDGTSFNTIVASGENSAYPHAKTSEKKIQNGDLIIVDIGAKYDGYCSDMTRTFIFGDVDEKKKELLHLVNSGQQFALDRVKAGLSGKKLDELVRNYFSKEHKQWGKRFIHSLGHGVGIDIHEKPYLSPISEDILEENMTVTIEPGLYIQGLGGARTEDQVVITEDGYYPLTKSKKIYYD
ncbi:MAG: M24 family metallopeptidase [Candidatus Lokiarchaeota archaeon]|nr:M24 family metallopeptidase [Candidatus Lokiarchaeota archaeon]MBD3337627.1 M24 family metallopeptidase [Candidatus Lokiarchaeota archaeon]